MGNKQRRRRKRKRIGAQNKQQLLELLTGELRRSKVPLTVVQQTVPLFDLLIGSYGPKRKDTTE